MTNVGEFNGRKVVSAENAKIDIEDVEDASTKKLSEDDKRLFGAWLKLTLEDSVKEVKVRILLLSFWLDANIVMASVCVA